MSKRIALSTQLKATTTQLKNALSTQSEAEVAKSTNNSLVQQLKLQIHTKEDELKQQQQLYNTLIHHKDQLSSQYHILQTKYDDNIHETETLKHEIQRSHHSQKLEKQQTQQLQDTYDTLLQEHDRIEKNYKTLYHKYDELNEELENVAQQYRYAKEKIQQLQQMNEQNTRTAAYQAPASNVPTPAVQQLQSQLHSIQTQLQQEIEKATYYYEAHNKLEDTLRQQSTAHTRELRTQSEQYEQQIRTEHIKFQDLHHIYNELQQQYQTINHEYQTIIQQRERLQQSINEKNTIIHEKQTTCNELTLKVQIMEQEMQQLKQQIQTINTELELSKTHVNGLQIQLTETTSKLTTSTEAEQNVSNLLQKTKDELTKQLQVTYNISDPTTVDRIIRASCIRFLFIGMVVVLDGFSSAHFCIALLFVTVIVCYHDRVRKLNVMI